MDRCAKNSGRFEFEFKARAAGMLLAVIVFAEDEFELWDLDCDRPVDFYTLERKERQTIERIIAYRFSQIRGYQEHELVSSERRSEIEELNNQRGAR